MNKGYHSNSFRNPGGRLNLPSSKYIEYHRSTINILILPCFLLPPPATPNGTPHPLWSSSPGPGVYEYSETSVSSTLRCFQNSNISTPCWETGLF
ncbi:hypothetical protein L873DRAFT_1495433 [Choiromyces venosus 120613-1]|uniref:Uncharacterized protein n=1 Tax=Choiromyces venosus 120613-1 TaxID=1336337 RepID=A0A3N4JBV7_9PEZI|nr:hypothetical protein L873DRAFT_1495433 [Choiromyces venosus 120613-1]